MNRQFRPNDRKILKRLRAFRREQPLAGHRTWVAVSRYLDFKGTRNGRHKHSYHEVCIALAGRGRFDHGDRSWHIGPGDLFLAHPGVVHEIISAARPALEICFVSFAFLERLEGAAGPEAELALRFERSRRVVVPRSSGLVSCYLAIAQTDASDEEHWRIVTSALANALVLEIMARAAPTSGLPPDHGGGTDDPRLELAFRYMDDNLERSLAVGELARQATTSERTLRRLVRRATGRTVVAEFARRRMTEAARRLLAGGSLSVAEVAYHLGFEDPSQFARDFRRAIGATPAQFRRQRGTVFDYS